MVTSIDGHDRVEKWIIQQGIGTAFGVAIRRGALTNESIKVEIRMTTAAEYDIYEAMGRALAPKPNSSRYESSLVTNAALNFANIVRVGIRTWGTPRDAKGVSWSATIDLVEVRIPKPVPLGPPDAEKPDTENGRKAKEVVRLFNVAKGPFPSGT